MGVFGGGRYYGSRVATVECNRLSARLGSENDGVLVSEGEELEVNGQCCGAVKVCGFSSAQCQN